MRELALMLCVIASTMLLGCGAALERAGVSRDFAAQFGCRAHKVSALGSGYRVEGCGRVASYACIEAHHHYHWDDSTTKVGHGELAGAVLAAVVASSLHADKCFLSYAERFERAPRLTSGRAVSVYRKHAGPAVPLLVARTVFAGGSLTLRAKPTEHPEHVMLSVRGVRRLQAAPCGAQLFHDGVELPVEEVRRADPFEAHVLLRADSLRDADRAARIAGNVCGLELELDETGRKTLGVFEARFREERARFEARVAAREAH